MQAQEIFDKLKTKFGTDVIEFFNEQPSDPYITVNSEKIFDIAIFLRDDDDLLFDYLNCLSGLDLGDNLCVVYHLYSMKFLHRITIKAMLPRESPNIATVERIWRTADWHERETYDMFGVNFVGHHNLIRILCPYDWEGYPLRKDYKTPEVFHGMKVPY